jgi:hypothetical protein
MSETQRIKERLVLDALTDEWRTTPEIAKSLDVKWEPGEHGDLDEVREDLYRLWLRGLIEQEPTHNGHRWRLKESVGEEGETHGR